MKIIKALMIILAFFSFACSLSRTEASLHPWYNPQNFHDQYNLQVEAYNRKSLNSKVPKITTLKRNDDNPQLYSSYFDGILPGGQLSVITGSNGKLESIMIMKEIDGYIQIKDKTVPKEIFKCTEIGVLILAVLGYPMNDNVSKQRVTDAIVKIVCNYDHDDNIEYLYNPSLGITYALAYKVSKGILFLWISTPSK